MTYRGRDYKMDASYWFDLARVTMSRPLWPRRCTFTDQLLWLKPAVRGETSYYMRSGAKRYDVRWADPKTFVEFKLHWS